ncbi:alpha/beta fold hydrolase [Roseateles cellulosilyticus]|uniref:Esterase n=1 Tax=Pelomonas cellulosilytica TaxID=2906762 RepID=A0ABS8XJ40_9BURK|nr:alpha/beta fold hydrolase [Pelomonas sp. P8]MCE4552881.1 hypothetical protein [Pelomonas sp. P8]
MMARPLSLLLGTCCLAGTAAAAPAVCDARASQQWMMFYDSVTMQADGRVSFRLCAPAAAAVKLSSTEIDGVPTGFDGKPPGLPMAKDEQGFWAATTPGPLAAGAYRYAFNVDGVDMPDPQGTNFSLTYRGARSVLDVPGPASAFHSAQPGVPQGLVSVMSYDSSTLGTRRRAHVYTPPGYEANGNRRYPVLYLVHGAGDSDDSWTSIGQANHILDNLIAAGKAQPMIVVMPFGHTPDRPGVDRFNNTDFGDDLVKDLMPEVERRFRTEPTATRRAMAGLSMGGAHTLNFGLPRPDLFGAVGIFSIGLQAGDPAKAYVARNAEALKRRAAAKSVVFYAFGKEDFLYAMAEPTRRMLDEQGIAYNYRESGGGHTWVNWRAYLNEFVPLLFR